MTTWAWAGSESGRHTNLIRVMDGSGSFDRWARGGLEASAIREAEAGRVQARSARPTLQPDEREQKEQWHHGEEHADPSFVSTEYREEGKHAPDGDCAEGAEPKHDARTDEHLTERARDGGGVKQQCNDKPPDGEHHEADQREPDRPPSLARRRPEVEAPAACWLHGHVGTDANPRDLMFARMLAQPSWG